MRMSHDFQLEKVQLFSAVGVNKILQFCYMMPCWRNVPHTSEFYEHVIRKDSDVLEKFDT